MSSHRSPASARTPRKWQAALIAVALLASLLAASAAHAGTTAVRGTLPATPPAKLIKPSGTIAPRTGSKPIKRSSPIRPGSAWPAAGRATTTLAGAGRYAQAAGLPLSLAGAEPASVEVALLDHAAAAAAGVNGVLFSLQPTLASSSANLIGLQVSLDYKGFANASGAGFGPRLHLVQLSGCALTTPALAACRQQTPISSANDARAQSLRTSKPLPMAETGPMVMAAVAGAASPNGDFTASSLAPSGSWSQGGATGGFNYSYPITVPTPATGAAVAPSVALHYSSDSIDGRIASTNNQSGWAGEGWDYSPGYIERTYRTCSDTATAGSQSDTSDKCWAGNIVTMSLGGTTTALVRDDSTGAWHPQYDTGQKIQLLTGASNSANGGEYWRITTTDGISYVFGQGVLPGGTAANQTNSVLTTPVYYQNSSDSTCYNATFANSKCATNLAWRWNLDYVVDGTGNAAAYYYTRESNYYGADNGATAVKYDRAAVLDHVDYGLRLVNASVYRNPATDRVSFSSAQRCLPDSGFACNASDFTAANASHWPDTPQDQDCAAPPASCANHAPTFWSRLRLTTIETSYYTSTGYQPVDTYTLGQSFPSTGDEELELDSISHVGHSSAGSSSAPLVTSFASQLLPNRVPNTGAQSDMYFWRLEEIDGETGLTTLVTYGQPAAQACSASSLPADPANDQQLCFPVKWTPQAHTQPILDYFQKYVLQRVQVTPHDGRAVGQITEYDYLGTPVWHADDNEVVPPADRTYGQFRGYGQVGTRFGDTGASFHGVADSQTSTITTYYRGLGGTIGDSISGDSTADNNAYAGQVHETQTFNGIGGPEIGATITDLTTKATTATRLRTGLPALTANIVVSAKVRTITDEPGISSTATRTTTSSYSYDALGQPTQQTDSADDGTPTTCTTTSYATPTTGNTLYIRNRVAEKIVSQQVCPTLGTAPSPVLTDVKTFYDGSTTAAQVPGAGLPTEVDTRLDGTSTPYFGKTKASFDVAGRQLTATRFVSSTDTTGRTTTTTFTPTLPATVSTTEVMPGPLTKTVVTNAKAQTVTTLYEPARGLPTEVVDVAGHKTDAEYDALGRVTGVWKPGQVHGTNPATVSYSYLVATSGPSSVTTVALVDNGSTNYRTSVSLLDGFGNQIQTQAQAAVGYTAVTDTFRDSHGWTVNSYNHWAIAGAPTTSLQVTGDDGVDDRTETSHDGAGRAVLATEYRGLTATWSTQTVYGGNETTVIPPTGGVAQSTVTNARGWTTAVQQYTSVPTVSGNLVTGTHQDTSYGYTALGQPSTITSASRSWSFTYDRGGRLTQQSDPDTGSTTNTWNDAGDLTQTKDANNVVLSYVYDVLGRRIDTYKTATQTSANLLDDWTWDTVQAGQLSFSEHHMANGAVWKQATNSYDGAGRPLSTTLTLPTGTTAEAAFLPSYTTGYTYTSTGQLATLAPASGGGLPTETEHFYYDSLGNPAALLGTNAIVTAATYSPYGEPTQYQLGAGNQLSSINYDYDPQTRRLASQSLNTSTVTPQLEARSFSYDPAGNLVRSTDTEGSPGAPTETQCYRYTALDQLSAAWSATDDCAGDPASVGSSVVGGPQPYWTSWTFTTSGLRSMQVQHGLSGASDQTTGYTYDLPGHADALHSTTGAIVAGYAVDAVGNVTSRTQTGANLTLGYDQENRILTMVGPGGSSDYVRDADGTELLRHDPTTATLYLPGEELTRTNATGAISGVRYYRFNGTEVAVRNAGVAFSPYWVMTDPHGSDQVAAMTTSSGVGPVIRRYLDPYGNPLGATSGGTWPDPHGFLDKPSVAASGTGTVTPVQDVGAREYEPGTGRFLQVDPVLDSGDPQSLNGYDYADNNPIGKSDPSGLRFACDSGYCDKSGTDMNPGGSGEGSDPCNGPGGQHSCGGGGSPSGGLAAGPGGGSARPGPGTAVAQCKDRSCVKRVIYQACSAKWEDVCDPVLDLQQQIQLILSPMSTSGWGLVGLVATIAGIITLPEVLAGCAVAAGGCALAAAIATGDVALINTIAVTLADAIAAGSVTAEGVAALNSAAAAGADAIPSTSSLATDLADATGGALKTNKGGYTVMVPYGSRGITVRIMDEGGDRTNYYRVSIPGKETYTESGEVSIDPELTHMQIRSTSLNDILAIIAKIQGGN